MATPSSHFTMIRSASGRIRSTVTYEMGSSHPPVGGFFQTGDRPGQLRLASGEVFPGNLPEAVPTPAFGEVVFSTGMTGYVESLTDPSYAGQILTFTYPLIGNYGVPSAADWESRRIFARGVVVSEACLAASHADAVAGFASWLRAQGVPLITGIDTRALTKTLREHGTINGAIVTAGARPRRFPPLSRHLLDEVTVDAPVTYNPRERKVVIAVDCGLKENIIRCLTALPVQVRRVPHDYDFSHDPYDGLFISNGPGNPVDARAAIRNLRRALKGNKPIFGICLGAQLLVLAAGAKTYKLPYGHRGHNQPCRESVTGRCVITSQNHGYAIDGRSLPAGWQVSHRNLNDGSVEGIRHRRRPFSAVQFHPEAAPGPTDSAGLFAEFVAQV